MKQQLASGLVMEYDDAGQGRVVVLLHGFPFDRAMWRPQVEALRDSYRLLVPDLRGFGGTGGAGERPTLEQMADDVAELLDALRITEPVVLGGLSMGGYITLAFARKHAPRLRGLILADTRAEADTDEAKANRDKLIAFARDHSGREVLDQMLPKLLGDATRASRPELAAELRRLAAGQSVRGIIAALQAMRDRPDARPVLPGIAVPALVLVGEQDALTPPAAAATLAAGIPAAKLVTILAAGHMANLEQPEPFNDALRAFLRTLP